MPSAKPAQQWERYGRTDPYYGVYAVPEFRGRELDESSRERFFASGERDLQEMFADISATVAPDFSPRYALEYGCGVGRLLIPLARRAEHAVGLDISPSMLAEARRNCDAFGLERVELRSAEELDHLPREFDLVLCALVLQHIPARAGERIVAQLVECLGPGGVGAIHLQVGGSRRLRAFNAAMKVPGAHNLLNLARRRPWDTPHMQMNVYDLNRVAGILRDGGVSDVHARLAERFGGFDACVLLFRV
jgi:SAM-dependent methyltransferase